MPSELTAYANTGIIALRGEPSDAAEMVTQLVMGETVDVLHEQQDSWVKVQAHYDGYRGWVNRKEIEFFEPGEMEQWLRQPDLRRMGYHTFRAGKSYEELALIPVGSLAVMEKHGKERAVRLPHRRYPIEVELSMLRGQSLLGDAISHAALPGGPCVEGVDSSLQRLAFLPARQPVFGGQLAGQPDQRQHLGGPALQRARRGEVG